MSLDNTDLLAIKAELTNDPKHLGLAVVAADDEANANKMNAIGETIQTKRYSLSSSTLFNSVDPGEFQALGVGQQAWFNTVLALGQINPFADTQIVVGIQNLFSSNTTTRPRFDAILTEDGSRVREMFQGGLISVDVQMTPSDISDARAAT